MTFMFVAVAEVAVQEAQEVTILMLTLHAHVVDHGQHQHQVVLEELVALAHRQQVKLLTQEVYQLLLQAQVEQVL
jgi:hypothetical protein